jgi:hypothetical protein
MAATAIRDRLYDDIRYADEKKLKAIYTMVEDEINEQINLWEDKDFLKEIDMRLDGYDSLLFLMYTLKIVRDFYNRTIHKALLEHLDKKQTTVNRNEAYWKNYPGKTTSYYQLTSGKEIDFVLNKEACYEVKETATESDLRNLITLAQNLNLKDCSVIGRHPVKLFDGYIWGGFIS